MSARNGLDCISSNVEIDPITGCWNWLGSLNLDGYACSSYMIENKRERRAYRISFYIYKGYVAAYVCHTCDNRKCVNPDHLYEGNPETNAQDRANRGRSSTRKGINNGRAVIDETLVLDIRRMYATGLYKQSELASKFNICQTNVSSIINKKTWTEI